MYKSTSTASVHNFELQINSLLWLSHEEQNIRETELAGNRWRTCGRIANKEGNRESAILGNVSLTFHATSILCMWVLHNDSTRWRQKSATEIVSHHQRWGPCGSRARYRDRIICLQYLIGEYSPVFANTFPRRPFWSCFFNVSQAKKNIGC